MAWANDHEPPRYFAVGIDDKGKLTLDSIQSLRIGPIKQILPRQDVPVSHDVSGPGPAKASRTSRDDSLSALSQEKDEENEGTAALAQNASIGDGVEEMPDNADTSIAQRIKRSSRKSRPVTYAESMHDDSDAEGSDAEPSAAEAPSFLVTSEGLSVVMTRDERRQRISSAELWLQHIERLRLPEKDVLAALRLCFGGVDEYYDYELNASDAEQDLARMIYAIKRMLHALQFATPASGDHSMTAELNELYADLDEAESAEDARKIKSLLATRIKDKSLFKYQRRMPFRTSPFGTRRKKLWKTEEQRQKMLPLSDEVSFLLVWLCMLLTLRKSQNSEDEDYEASLTSSGATSGSDSGSEAESQASHAQPPRKRLRLGRQTASKGSESSKSKSGDASERTRKKNKAGNDSMPSKSGKMARKRPRSQSSSEADDSASDGDAEDSQVEDSDAGTAQEADEDDVQSSQA